MYKQLTTEETRKIFKLVMKKPHSDAQQDRKKGKWIDYPIADGCLQCSVCGILRFEEANYCPNCGAEMQSSKE